MPAAVARRNTHQRQLVLDAVRSRWDHPTADDIFATVRAHDPKVSRGTVYRNLNLLAEEGAILSIKVPGGNRFDRTVEPHGHVVCTSCGAVVDVPQPFDHEIDSEVADSTGYDVKSHYTIFEGLCPQCK